MAGAATTVCVSYVGRFLDSIFQDDDGKPREKGRHNRLAQEKARAARVSSNRKKLLSIVSSA